MYLKNKGFSLAELFILKQLFTGLVSNVLSIAGFHNPLKAGVTVLTKTHNLSPLFKALPLFKGLSVHRNSFTHTSDGDMAFSFCGTSLWAY